MFAHLLLALAVFCVAVSGKAPTSKSISASVKDTSVNGLEGLNINWEAPFKLDDYIVGFRYALGNIKKAPESLFAKRSYDTPLLEGSATVDVDYNLDSKVFAVESRWISKKDDFEVSAKGDSKDKITSIGAATSQNVEGKDVILTSTYDLIKKKLLGSAKVTVDDTTVKIQYDTVDKNALLSVAQRLDDKNTVTPSISLKTGDMTYGWKRSWNGGSVDTTYCPGDRVDVVWKDEGANGVWTTKAEIPVDDHSATKISFSRDFNY